MSSRGQFIGEPGIASSYVAGIPVRTTRSPDLEGVTIMSRALWCNINDPETNAPHQIGHSFDGNDPSAQHMTKTQKVQVPTGNSYGGATYQQMTEVTEEMDICGYHWGRQNPFRAQNEITEGPTTHRQRSLDDLEDDDTEWRAGYEARREEELLKGRR